MTDPKHDAPRRQVKILCCKTLPFQRGDFVMTPKGEARVTAVGIQVGPRFKEPVYRTGRSTYWFGWQLRLRLHTYFIEELK